MDNKAGLFLQPNYCRCFMTFARSKFYYIIKRVNSFYTNKSVKCIIWHIINFAACFPRVPNSCYFTARFGYTYPSAKMWVGNYTGSFSFVIVPCFGVFNFQFWRFLRIIARIKLVVIPGVLQTIDCDFFN